MKKEPDFVWKLMAAVRPRGTGKSAPDVRVHSQAEAGMKGVNVKHYDSFEAAPDLILFEGWYDKSANTAELEEKSKTTLRAAI